MISARLRGPLLATAALVGPGVSAAAVDGSAGWLPQGDLFAPIAAGSIEALNYVGYAYVDPAGSKTFHGALTSLGSSFPLYRWLTASGSAWQLDLFGDAKSQFNFDGPSDELLNIDYFVGFPLSWRRDPWSMRVRLFHQSSHLGDEYLLSEDPPRQDISYEAVDVLVAYDVASTRWYAGGGRILSDDGQLEDNSFRAGAEYVSAGLPLLGAHFVAGLDLFCRGDLDEAIESNATAGLRWQGREPGSGSVTAAAQAFTGPLPFGQFNGQSATYYGVLLYFSLG